MIRILPNVVYQGNIIWVQVEEFSEYWTIIQIDKDFTTWEQLLIA